LTKTGSRVCCRDCGVCNPASRPRRRPRPCPGRSCSPKMCAFVLTTTRCVVLPHGRFQDSPLQPADCRPLQAASHSRGVDQSVQLCTAPFEKLQHYKDLMRHTNRRCAPCASSSAVLHVCLRGLSTIAAVWAPCRSNGSCGSRGERSGRRRSRTSYGRACWSRRRPRCPPLTALLMIVPHLYPSPTPALRTAQHGGCMIHITLAGANFPLMKRNRAPSCTFRR